ncbi:hypothetical protein L9F63_002679 [Diploptera punctata]|uniref:Cathepsin L n=1 Tax=Diploptera punctata TaxID=6984 RepID=A0AAD7ZS07_DIPPU|nr:hypothetical protein L9F63_002679 [Diploptera punctata]
MFLYLVMKHHHHEQIRFRSCGLYGKPSEDGLDLSTDVLVFLGPYVQLGSRRGMKFVIPLLVAITACYCASIQSVFNSEWNLFKLEYGKNYETAAEEEFRKQVFLENKYKIEKHNARYELGLSTYKLAINKFSDMLHDEYLKLHGSRRNKGQLGSQGSTFVTPENVNIPDEMDWRKLGAVTHVKDQGHCGSCYAFGAVGSLEGQQFRKTGNLTALSEQNIVDCGILSHYKTFACGGGFGVEVFKFIQYNGGIDTEESYPYVAYEQECMYNNKTIGARVTGHVDLPSGDEQKLKEAVAVIGPVNVAICVYAGMHKYSEGIYCEEGCGNDYDSLSHEVVVVGYGTDEETKLDYWLIKNSSGAEWGENGYIRICRNKGNRCGVATDAHYPLV